MSLAVLDPGSRGSGVALFSEKILRGAAYVRNPRTEGNGPEEWVSMANAAWEWVQRTSGVHPLSMSGMSAAVEVMRVRQAGAQKGDPNDLIPLAAITGAFVAAPWVAAREGFAPEDWKGQTNKQNCLVMIRVKQRLSREEFETIEFPKNTCEICRDQSFALRCHRVVEAESRGKVGNPCPIHNAYDAIGIGLKAVGRFEKKRVIAR